MKVSVSACPKCNCERYSYGQLQPGYWYSGTDRFDCAWGYWYLNGNGFYEQAPMDRGQEGFRIRCSECGYTWLERVES